MVNNSNQTYFIQIILWTTANGISIVSVYALLFAILRSPKVRSNSFNLYLVFSLVPDAYKDVATFAANLANLLADSGSPNACKIIGMNIAYWWCASLWMGFLTFVQIYHMLVANKNTRRYRPPTAKRVVVTSAIIHVYSMIMATLTVMPIEIIPTANPASNCVVYPEAGNRAQLLFYYLVFMPLTALIPSVLVTLLCFQIWWKQLIPLQNAKYRSLLFYFARLLSTVYIIIITLIVSAFVTGWFQAIIFVIFNLVGFFQVCLALYKKDIRNVFLSTWCCQNRDETSTSTIKFTFLQSFRQNRRKKNSDDVTRSALPLGDQKTANENEGGLSGMDFDIDASQQNSEERSFKR